MTLDVDVTRLFEYEFWANAEAARAIAQMGPAAPMRATHVMAHIIGASSLWLARLKGETPTNAVWPTFSVELLKPELDRLEVAWREWLGTLTVSRLGQLVAYVNTRGETWKSAVRDILTHVLMHSAYHRGQVATSLGQHGGQPASTDFIHAVREELV